MYRFVKVAGLILMICAELPSLHAQSFYNSGATVSVLANTIFSVKDSLVNTGTFINNGNLVIGGTWLNTGSYDAGVGEITFNSTSPTTPQIINHNNQSFSKLTISGGGKKKILADITIEEEIILTDGVIEAENNSRVIISSGAKISGGSDQSHIHAPVYQKGSGEKLYPLGNGLVYLPVSLLNLDNVSIGVEGIEPLNVPLLKAPSVDEISNVRYWRIHVEQGTLNSQIVLPMRDETALSNNNVAVVQAPSITDQFESIGKSASTGNTSNGSATSERMVTMPFVALASSSDDGSIFVYNAVSPNNDDLNEFLKILNIEYFPENTVRVFSRWGDKVFEIRDYDNKERVFRGKSNINGESDLVNGTYFYVIETKTGNQKISGFLSLKN